MTVTNESNVKIKIELTSNVSNAYLYTVIGLGLHEKDWLLPDSAFFPPCV